MNGARIGGEFKIIRKVGEGTFSFVYLAADAAGKQVAIKQVTRTSAPSRIANELRFLIDLRGEKGVIELISAVREENDVFLVFPYIENTLFKDFLEKRTVHDIKKYMYELLVGLKNIHKAGIIHRDVKPSNFLFDPKDSTGVLIDFGLSQRIEIKEKELKEKKTKFFFSAQNVYRTERVNIPRPPGYIIKDTRPAICASRSGTRGFRAPEVLFRVETQSTKIDIWSAGVILLTLLTRKYPFFVSKDDTNAIVELGCIFGDKEMRSAAKYYKRTWKSNIEECMCPKIPFKTIVSLCSMREESVPDSLYDLLEKMLCLKSSERISAEKALEHRFFDDIVKYVE